MPVLHYQLLKVFLLISFHLVFPKKLWKTLQDCWCSDSIISRYWRLLCFFDCFLCSPLWSLLCFGLSDVSALGSRTDCVPCELSVISGAESQVEPFCPEFHLWRKLASLLMEVICEVVVLGMKMHWLGRYWVDRCNGKCFSFELINLSTLLNS